MNHSILQGVTGLLDIQQYPGAVVIDGRIAGSQKQSEDQKNQAARDQGAP